MRFNFSKQPFIGLFFILFNHNVLAASESITEPLNSAQALLAKSEFDQAFILFKKEANKNNPLAQMTMGLFYKLAWGNVEQDINQSCQWFYKSAQSNIPQAQKEFADCINFNDYSWGLAENNSKEELTPLYWYNKAYENGIYNAACDIGRLYLGTKWQGKDLEQAITWCKISAERSVLTAQISLADILLIPGPHQDISSAEYWYQQALLKDSGEAAYKLAGLYYSIAITHNNDKQLLAKALLTMEKSSSLKYQLSYKETASLYWSQLPLVDESQKSAVLAKSYLWAKAAYQVSPNDENSQLLDKVTTEMPAQWQKKLNLQVDKFLK